MRIVALIAFFVAAAPALAASLGPMRGQVLRVIDGVTVVMRVAVWIDQEITTAVRLSGVDAPELFRPICAVEKEKAAAAKAFVEDFLGGGEAVLFDIRHDKYAGRVVARIEKDGRDLGAALLAAGHAVADAGKDWCAGA